MIPVRIEGETRDLGPPSNWAQITDVPCGRLSIRDEPGEGDTNVMWSQWQLEPGDLSQLALGAPIYFGIYGQIHPVVTWKVGEPPEGASEARTMADLKMREALGAALETFNRYAQQHEDEASRAANAGNHVRAEKKAERGRVNRELAAQMEAALHG
jgi:hypothetical protein